jgi:hypothetical protein
MSSLRRPWWRGRASRRFRRTCGAGTHSPARAREAAVDDDAIASATAEALGLPYAEDLSGRPVSHDFLTAVPIAFARRHGMIGLAGEDQSMPVALADLAQWPHLQILAKILGKRIQPFFAPRAEILRAINAAYQQQAGQAERLIDPLDAGEVMRELDSAAQSEDLLDVASRAPVIKLVSLILLEAVKRRASDVHVQPYEDRLVIRFRTDGILHDVFEPPKALQAEVISRIKVMAGMNIAEHRLAQDGRTTVEVGDRIVDLRISTLPTSFGERAVIRLLDKSIRLYELPELGMPEAVMEAFRKLIHMYHGIILVTGPTGSGKSTTLYAALQEIDSQEMNILTLEDPIEYRLEGISQTQVSERKGMTFASGLRHVLRQDPDIIMVGEIRDAETARLAAREQDRPLRMVVGLSSRRISRTDERGRVTGAPLALPGHVAIEQLIVRTQTAHEGEVGISCSRLGFTPTYAMRLGAGGPHGRPGGPRGEAGRQGRQRMPRSPRRPPRRNGRPRIATASAAWTRRQRCWSWRASR